MGKSKEEVNLYHKDHLEQALEKASAILNKPTSFASFNGIIGGKGTTHNVSPLDYTNPEDYVEAWMESHEKKYNKEKYKTPESSKRIHKMLEDDFLKEFIENFLARIYFNKHDKNKSSS